MKLRSAFIGLIFFAFTVIPASAQTPQPAPEADVEYQLAAILYTQKAAEYRALCYQAYNIARLRLDADLDKKNVKKLPKAERKRPRAIIVDIDETVLDNSPAQAYSYTKKLGFDLKNWYAWGDMRKAKAVPGAVDFLNYAVSKGVKIFYISNRDEVQRQATIDNLRSVGFKDVSDENVFLRETESGKDARRARVSEKYRVVMLMGDNLDDFTSLFEKKPVDERFAETDKARYEFGKRFIVLPNAIYGTWENAIYEYKHLTDKEKAEMRTKALELP